MPDPGQGGSQIPYNDKIDQDTWDADTRSIAQSSKDFSDSDLPDIQFAPPEHV
jgi:hypothetical protein